MRTDEAEIAGKFAAIKANGEAQPAKKDIAVNPGDGVNTCVPQHIRLADGADESVRLFMRARSPERKVTLHITDANGDVMKKPLPIVKPSEMIAVDIPAAKVKALAGDVTVSIEGGK